MNINHSFHIPVMGLAYTVDTPVKVAHLGISSVISIVDDYLVEKMREFYSRKMNLPFKGIPLKSDDSRARRIKAYLDLVDQMVSRKFEELIENFQQKGSELERYFELLPNADTVREKFRQISRSEGLQEVKKWLRSNLRPGSIDVNIMTKLDKVNFRGEEALPAEHNDAHAALRGFATSTLSSSLVLSAGMNPRLYGYLEQFNDFFPGPDGQLRKKITLKVSDYRSALIQGRFLAKKGIWVSEYRVESGLNCGGHAFASQGHLLGPILHEFREKRNELIKTVFSLYQKALQEKDKAVPGLPPDIKVTAQGGIGTSEEHRFLLEEYRLDSIGWGSPFLLVPEVCKLDRETLDLLLQAGEKDLYLSEASPLGVPFNNIRNTSQQKQIGRFAAKGQPGFPCTKRFLAMNTEYEGKPICTASRQYIGRKTAEMHTAGVPSEEQKKETARLTVKECLCEGLTNAAYLARHISPDFPRRGVSICPGPNIAYFSREASLGSMTAHIYGKENLLEGVRRPNLFIKELDMYTAYLEKQLNRFDPEADKKQASYYHTFRKNLQEGIVYYRKLFARYEGKLKHMHENVSAQLEGFSKRLESFRI